jgi:hypothetical protein
MIVLRPGERLVPGQEVRADGMLLAYQGDGNLVLYRRDGVPVWASDTFGAPGFATMQGDGNFVVYDAAGVPIWASDTQAPGGSLDLSTEGLKILGMATVWSTPPFEGGEPGPVPTPVLYGDTRRFGARAVGDDRGPQLYAGLSRFYHVWAMKADPDRVKREDDSDVAVGMDFKRVLLQVGSLDPSDYWAGRVADQNWPDHQQLVARMCDIARERGIRISACIIGKGNGMDRQSNRRPYVQRMAEVLRDYPDVVLLAQIMNEPSIEGRITASEILELEAILRSTAPNLITSTGAYGDLEGGADGLDPRSWGMVGTPHLDRDQTKSEMRDRPWRQPWDWGLSAGDHGIMNDEPIGPRSSVAGEDRALVLRSHATVSFVSRFMGSVFHADEGIRGNGDLASVPGYREFAACKRFLPGDLPNGVQVNANTNFPNRHWQLEDNYLRVNNGNSRGIVRAYGVQQGGFQFTVPFGPVSDYELLATRAIRVECFQQDVNDLLWERTVAAGERVRFSAQHPDYVLKSRAL